ncbi:MAG: hypothetical protein Fur0018_23250 [Anaerolineales bacterium]
MPLDTLAYMGFVILAPIFIALLVFLMVRLWRYRYRSDIPFLWGTLGLLCLWLLADTLEVLTSTLEGTLFFGRLGYVFIALFSPTFFLFVVNYTTPSPLSANWVRRQWALYVLPLCTILIMLVDARYPALLWRGWEVRRLGQWVVLQHIRHGAWFWVHSLYSYGLDLLGVGLLWKAYVYKRHTPQRESSLLLTGVVIALVTNLLYLSGLLPFHKDYTPISLAVAAILIGLGVLRHVFFDLRPLAALAVADNLGDGIFMLDKSAHIIDVNAAGEAMLGLPRPQILRQYAPGLICPCSTDHMCHDQSTTMHLDFQLREGLICDLRCIPLYTPNREFLGRVLTLRDISDRKKSEMRLIEQANQVHSLYFASQVLLECTDMAEVLEKIVEQAYRFIPCRWVIWLPLDEALPREKHAYPAQDFLSPALERALLVDTSQITIQTFTQYGQTYPTLRLPIRHGERKMGMLCFFLEKERPRSFEEEKLLKNFALTCAAALHSALQHHAIQQHAITDALTDIYNRRGFFEAVQRSLQTARGYAIVMVDMDTLKQINDTYGHKAGDLSLQTIGKILKQQMRSHDVISRYGGDEFLILLTDVTVFDTQKIVQRLQRVIQNTPISCDEHSFHIHASIGVSMGLNNEDIEDTIRRADAALYDAKAHGRNQICWADTNPPPVFTSQGG